MLLSSVALFYSALFMFCVALKMHNKPLITSHAIKLVKCRCERKLLLYDVTHWFVCVVGRRDHQYGKFMCFLLACCDSKGFLCLLQIQYVLLFSRQGKVRLQKWYQAYQLKEKKKIQRELVSTILSRKSKMCNFLEYKDLKVVYKR